MADNLFFKNIERNDTLTRYFNDIKKFKVMTQEEEKEFIVKAQNGDVNAQNMLVNSNQRYIFSFAKKFASYCNVNDLVSIATEGFIKAIEKFDVARETRLCTYANQWMGQKIRAYLIDEHLSVRKSNYNKTYSKVTKIKNKFFLENGRFPQVEEIQYLLEKEYGVVIKEICDLIDVNINSISQSYDEGETSVEDSTEYNLATSSINAYEVETDKDYTKALVATMINTLSDREQVIIKKVFGIGCYPMELDEIAKEMGMSKERIRQIKVDVCKKLKERFSSSKKRVI